MPLILIFITIIAGCSITPKEKTVFVPIYVDHRCFNDDGEFDDSIGADDLDCGNMWFLEKKVYLKSSEELRK